MKITATATPTFTMTLTRNQLNVLMLLSKRHYDGRCRRVSEPGQGSFLWGWQVGFDWAPDDVDQAVQFNRTELDTMAKILESRSSGLIEGARDKFVADGLNSALWQLIRQYEKACKTAWPPVEIEC